MSDPGMWTVLGRAIRADRERQGLTREELAQRVRAAGQQVTSRSIGTLEEGPPAKRGGKRPSLEPTVAALGWRPGWTDRILAGEDPSTVLARDLSEQATADSTAVESPRSRLLELVPALWEFSRTAARLGAPAGLREEFDQVTQRLVEWVQASQASRSSYSLAAYRPHAAHEGVPADDAARIAGALDRG